MVIEPTLQKRTTLILITLVYLTDNHTGWILQMPFPKRRLPLLPAMEHGIPQKMRKS